MTGAQESYLNALAREAGTEMPGDLTKASEKIEELQEETGRGKSAAETRTRPAKKAT